VSFNTLYQDELSYLRELGAEFSRANPKLAPFLAREANDPDVERLLEGFAFLTARLRQRLDDELPELVHGLIRLVWPQYLRPVPPLTVVAFEATGTVPGIVTIPRGTSLASRPVDGVSCRFRTCFSTNVLPLALTRTEIENRGGSARLTLQLRLQGASSFAVLQGTPLRLFFNTERDPAVGRALLLWLLRHGQNLTATTDGGGRFELGPGAMSPVGFAEEEAVLPYPPQSFSGFRLLQEYLTFPSKFLFVDIGGLAPLAGAGGRALTVSVAFDRPFPEQLRLTEGQIRLNCTPAINLFPHDAHPIRRDRSRTEFLLKPAGNPSATVYSVDTVTGFRQGRAERIVYEPFEAFRHDLPGETAKRPFFRERLRPALVGRRVEHTISFIARDGGAGGAAETISIGLTCTNGSLAERLPIGSIDQPTTETPAAVGFSNIASVSPEVPPPIGQDLLWRLIANLSRNYASLVEVGSLRHLLAAYDFRALHDTQARRRLELLLEALERFETASEDTLVRGVPARLRRITLHAAESKIGGEGELFLLGSVLDAFLAVYASINSLHAFGIRGTESNVVYRWPERTGAAQPH
jgi:type VI secretion system protein ImpG